MSTELQRSYEYCHQLAQQGVALQPDAISLGKELDASGVLQHASTAQRMLAPLLLDKKLDSGLQQQLHTTSWALLEWWQQAFWLWKNSTACHVYGSGHMGVGSSVNEGMQLSQAAKFALVLAAGMSSSGDDRQTSVVACVMIFKVAHLVNSIGHDHLRELPTERQQRILRRQESAVLRLQLMLLVLYCYKLQQLPAAEEQYGYSHAAGGSSRSGSSSGGSGSSNGSAVATATGDVASDLQPLAAYTQRVWLSLGPREDALELFSTGTDIVLAVASLAVRTQFSTAAHWAPQQLSTAHSASGQIPSTISTCS